MTPRVSMGRMSPDRPLFRGQPGRPLLCLSVPTDLRGQCLPAPVKGCKQGQSASTARPFAGQDPAGSSLSEAQARSSQIHPESGTERALTSGFQPRSGSDEWFQPRSVSDERDSTPVGVRRQSAASNSRPNSKGVGRSFHSSDVAARISFTSAAG